MKNFLKLIVSLAACLLAGGLGTVFTVSSIPTWYQNLNRPVFSPPNWIFGPVWTILYILMGVSLYLIWKKAGSSKMGRDAFVIFGIQLFLNAIWSPVFFGLKNLFFALIIIVFMWFYIVKTIKAFSRLDKNASYLLYPYLAWVSFATVLNFSFWLLNK